ncbi:hypothetical protein [Periweissella cryptocerci]|uniref:hypothetical protein n=1 Tax=Periweissella cryptocerci TaxID=2506420 RepID=UPI00140476FB|nr:hypothetical protein [Periweissella cryptocerci]
MSEKLFIDDRPDTMLTEKELAERYKDVWMIDMTTKEQQASLAKMVKRAKEMGLIK